MSQFKNITIKKAEIDAALFPVHYIASKLSKMGAPILLPRETCSFEDIRPVEIFYTATLEQSKLPNGDIYFIWKAGE